MNFALLGDWESALFGELTKIDSTRNQSNNIEVKNCID
jgi:hypothetical protein